MDQVIYKDEKEQQKVESFIREKKDVFERQEELNAHEARVKGEVYQKKEFPGISEEEALNIVRTGWKSRLEQAFERKRRREEARGIKYIQK